MAYPGGGLFLGLTMSRGNSTTPMFGDMIAPEPTLGGSND